MRPRILQLIESFHCGGSEWQAVQLARLLHENSRYEVNIACLDRRGMLRAELDDVGVDEIPEYRLTSFYDTNCLLQMRRFVRYLQRTNTALVHTHGFYTNVFGMAAARWANVPVRVASRREMASALRSTPQRMIERCSFAIAHAVIANCDCVGAEIVAEGVSKSKVVIVHNGLNLERFPKTLNGDRESTIESLGIRARPSLRMVTLVANLRSTVKDHATFIKAAALVRSVVPDAAFLIAGEGELAASVQAQASEAGLGDSIFFLGRCDAIPQLLAISDICVLTSKAEGFPNAILEYMAASRPVVTTNAGGASEAVIDGITGFVVPVANASMLAARVIYLLRNPTAARRMGELGRLRVEQMFSTSAQLQKVERLYDSLLGEVSAQAVHSPLASLKRYGSAVHEHDVTDTQRPATGISR